MSRKKTYLVLSFQTYQDFVFIVFFVYETNGLLTTKYQVRVYVFIFFREPFYWGGVDDDGSFV